MALKIKTLLFLVSLLLPAVAVAEESIKQLTINDVLQQKKAQAISQGRKANALINESSPYLLQHAYNPVNWYAWGEEAFAKAKKENKPIFLSIGYATCHWCHVMAHESFENEKIAALLNKNFVSIKLDREQRPDIDSVYMSATQLINGHGGWPMSVFLDHQLRPFHAATYYPPFSSETQTGLQEVLIKLHDLWLNQPEKIHAVATAVTARITALADDTTAGGVLNDNVNRLALQQISALYDEEFGGFSAAPKFPRPGIFSFLTQLLATEVKNKQQLQRMLKTTLDAMAAGGLYDQVAGGFHRYSVDARWQVPHFEKMLYSQALMVMAYADYYKNDPQEKYKNIIYQTLVFAKAEMSSSRSAYYSALDADSERPGKPGEQAEGAYYLWSLAELEKVLSQAELAFLKVYFGLDEDGNIASDPQKEFAGLNVLSIDEDYGSQALKPQQAKLLASAREKLQARRASRPRPQLDDKIITAWNGMMLAALAKSAVVFNDKGALQDAISTAGFIKKHLYNKTTGSLYRQYRVSGRAVVNGKDKRGEGLLADYVWLIYGLLEMYRASDDVRWLNWAIQLQHRQDQLFLDAASGAYYEATASDKHLLFRSKSIFDSVIPSANAIAMANLRSLSLLSEKRPEKKRYDAQADKLVSSFATVINSNPASAAMLLAIETQYRAQRPETQQ